MELTFALVPSLLLLAYATETAGIGDGGSVTSAPRSVLMSLEASGQSGLLAQFSTMILKRFEQQSTFAQHPEAQVQVPAGWKVISGGAMANYSGAGSLLTKSMPLVVNGVPRGWIAASKNHFIPDPCVLTAYAIALYDPNDKWEVVVKEQELGAPQRNPVISAKLEDGFALVGGGAYDMFTEPGNLLVESRPSDDGKSWIAGGKDHIDASPAKIKAFAIGVRSVIFGKPTCSLKTSISFEDRSPSETVEASTGYAIVGGGAVADRGGEGNMLVGLVPSCDGSSFFGKATDLKLPDPKKLTVYAIQCKNVVFGSYPSCGTQSWLSLGQSSLIMSENFPNNYPSLHFCRWSFACSQDMTLQCSHFQLPSSLLCWQSDFIYNNRRSCGSSTELKSPVNVGKDLSVAFYSIGASGPGFKCKVTCGSGSAPSCSN